LLWVSLFTDRPTYSNAIRYAPHNTRWCSSSVNEWRQTSLSRGVWWRCNNKPITSEHYTAQNFDGTNERKKHRSVICEIAKLYVSSFSGAILRCYE